MMWHQKSIDHVFAELNSSQAGLPANEAERRLSESGPNELREKRQRSPLVMLVTQFTDLLIVILIIAAVVAALIGDVRDALPIIAIVIINAIIGFSQEYRAEKSLKALKKMASQKARVIRDGQMAEVEARTLVSGDFILIEAGTIVPADLRLVEAVRLQVDESALTGESVPVEKLVPPLEQTDLPLGDRLNMAYMGTVAVYGRGAGIVVATGMSTELGAVATLLSTGEEQKTPLQRRLALFGKKLSLVILIICAVVFVAGMLRGEALVLMLMTAISLAVAAIPEALPAVVTIALAFGARKMVKQNALIRRLPAVETLGSVTCICTDKTGTLTMNRMEVVELYIEGRVLALAGLTVPAPANDSTLPATTEAIFFMAASLNSDILRKADGTLSGDPTEVALADISARHGFSRETLDRNFPRVAELPFDSERKLMTTFHQSATGLVSFTKGAVEVIAGDLLEGGEEAFHLLENGEKMAARGLRTICIAMRRWDALPDRVDTENVERDLVILGIAGIKDPPRPEVFDAVALCRQAGITPVMITGDHLLTATAIARELGILDDAGQVVSGAELTKLDSGQLEELVGKVRVYARVAPAQKLDIVTALQNRGECVAMTGDGVNDAPALRRADIGIAMGITGTDVAKGASSLILLDDNFATIVGAVREGRRIYRNIIRFITYSLTANAGTLWLVFLAPFLGLPLPLLPIQILWLNLLCDSLPGLALTAEPGDDSLMRTKPIPLAEGIFSEGRGWYILGYGLFLGGSALALQWWGLTAGLHWQSMIFTFLILSRMSLVMQVRSARASILQIGLFSNRPLVGAVLLTVMLQMAVINLPSLQAIFRTSSLTVAEFAMVLAATGLVLVAGEVDKIIRRSVCRRSEPASNTQ